jgi:hypothetical protein
LGFHLLAQTLELKSLYIDCFFDRIAGEVMGRGLVRPDHPRNGPGTVVLREFAPRRIAGEMPFDLVRSKIMTISGSTGGDDRDQAVRGGPIT